MFRLVLTRGARHAHGIARLRLKVPWVAWNALVRLARGLVVRRARAGWARATKWASHFLKGELPRGTGHAVVHRIVLVAVVRRVAKPVIRVDIAVCAGRRSHARGDFSYSAHRAADPRNIFNRLELASFARYAGNCRGNKLVAFRA